VDPVGSGLIFGKVLERLGLRTYRKDDIEDGRNKVELPFCQNLWLAACTAHTTLESPNCHIMPPFFSSMTRK